MSTNLQAIILAAGKSTRFNTDTTKLLEPICGQPMILYPVKLLQKMSVPTTLIVGYQKNSIREIIKKNNVKGINFVIQKEQHGTGHAILCARDSWHKENILIMNGDMPLVTSEIIDLLYKKHRQMNAAISFVTAHADPINSTYGRVIQTPKSIKIIEAHNFKGDLSEHCCINAGIYIVSKDFLEKNIDEIKRNEESKEFYFTDLIKIASDKGYTISTTSAPFDHIRGINTLQELWASEQIKRAELIKYWMDHGVRFSVAQNIHIDLDVTIGSGSYIGCGVHLLNGTTIGKKCRINESSTLNNAHLEDNVIIDAHTIINDSAIGAKSKIGPFAHIRNNTILAAETIIGNFVEIKNSTIGVKTKAKHLTYLGDAQIGSNVNVGAGTITCNHDGMNKHQTTIEDNAYIGSNNTIVAPLTIKKNAFTAAGSVITKDVPENALAFGRARQVNKKDYAKKLRKKSQNDAESSSEEKKKDSDTLSFVGAIKINNDTQSPD
ncbi:MAG: bifunctional UDP-N-acetylglucosamine diphosphorylase/glucosamine-1-phosphate N-acetyltransferase GlmU [bacterium]|nr:bifunctional UDP-N-acetylglucosamine diphosphorylase/glucosamine-1-phosphate N-acetyltransferase GlmU [bacterium]